MGELHRPTAVARGDATPSVDMADVGDATVLESARRIHGRDHRGGG